MNITIDPYRKKLGVNDAVCCHYIYSSLGHFWENNKTITLKYLLKIDKNYTGVLIVVKQYLSSLDKSLNS